MKEAQCNNKLIPKDLWKAFDFLLHALLITKLYAFDIVTFGFL